MNYGEQEIVDFDIDKEEHYWPNKHNKNYTIKITLPEYMAKCPRSGYPDFAVINLEYIPEAKVIELKAIKLYINTFMYKEVSHEDAVNKIFNTLYENLKPRWMKVVAVFKPRGNVDTVITIDSDKM